MRSPNSRARLRYHDYIASPDDMRYELIGGALILLPSPHRDHQAAQARLGSPLHLFAAPNEPGEVYFAPRDVVLSNTDVLQPDLMFIS